MENGTVPMTSRFGKTFFSLRVFDMIIQQNLHGEDLSIRFTTLFII